jgi:hypothetical protein
MAIEIRRVNGTLRKRYVVHVTPPHATSEWQPREPMSRRQREKRLYAFGNHTQDIAEAFAAANDEWEAGKAGGRGGRCAQ